MVYYDVDVIIATFILLFLSFVLVQSTSSCGSILISEKNLMHRGFDNDGWASHKLLFLWQPWKFMAALPKKSKKLSEWTTAPFLSIRVNSEYGWAKSYRMHEFDFALPICTRVCPHILLIINAVVLLETARTHFLFGIKTLCEI